MRLEYVLIADASESRFQIPMRGNEGISFISLSPCCTMFQIPMRGNESDGAGTVRAYDAGVPNPHEG